MNEREAISYKKAQAELQREMVRFDQEVADLSEYLDDMIKLAGRAKEALKHEMLYSEAGGVASNNMTVTDSTLKKIMSLATQERLSKVVRKKVETLSDEDRLEALATMVKTMDYPVRRQFILRVLRAHNEATQAAKAVGLLTGEEVELERVW
jgi:hypothetical protein